MMIVDDLIEGMIAEKMDEISRWFDDAVAKAILRAQTDPVHPANSKEIHMYREHLAGIRARKLAECESKLRDAVNRLS